MRGRVRSSVDGGYVRKTLSLPKTLVDDIEKYLNELGAGTTISTFMTEAGGLLLAKRGAKK